ncbi:hypothetical protein K501DRAFT_85618 [Backusella circina FSU 941]|nr:hypothetical protein K501DRAFT_85618 [Backusella circina FSU 941]
MLDCAVCPKPKCISPSAIGLAPTVETKSNNGPMIGGIVGGLLGLGLVLGLGVYCYLKRSKSSGKLPIMFTANNRRSFLFNNNNNNSQDEKTMSPNPAVVAAIAQRTDTSRQSKYITMSDLQSTTSSQPNRPPTLSSQNVVQHHRLSHLIQDNRQSMISNASSDLSDLEDLRSIASSVTNQTPKSVATVQAVQVTRAKPQIMRVNSVKSTNGVNRSGSVRTILTAVEDEDSIENPFKDGDINKQ